MILTLGNSAFEFTRHALEIKECDIKNTFARVKNKTLRYLVSESCSPSRKHKEKVFNEYSDYLDVPIGKFLLMLKEQGNEFYKEFLIKEYGDGLFCKFAIKDNSIFYKKGLYVFCVDDELVYVGKTTDCYYKRIKAGYGNISPANCYAGRLITNCRINHLINTVADRIIFKVNPMDNDDEIENTEKKLIQEYKRKQKCMWNK